MSIPKKKIEKFFKGRIIAALGLGMENFELIKFILANKVQCELTVCDARNKAQLSSRYKELKALVGKCRSVVFNWRLGKNYDSDLAKFNLILRSPGYPLHSLNLVKATADKKIISKKGSLVMSEKNLIKVTSPMNLFFRLSPTKNLIGITGTKGKSTTAALIYHILKKANKRVYLGGNIGLAPFKFIQKLRKNDWVVLELSSWQLEDMDMSPKIAVLTNFYRDHLTPADPHNPNYHKSIKDYWRAKMNIFGWQKINDIAIINKNLEKRELNFGYSHKIYFAKSNLSSRLLGEHNKENIAAAIIAARYAKIKNDIIKKAVLTFRSLSCRLESTDIVGGVHFYNDSFATTPESTITAINAFSFPIVLIAGGADKGASFLKLARLISIRVKYIVLLRGGATERFRNELLRAGYPRGKIRQAKSMEAAVKIANSAASPGDTILLSPACASFGLFKDYKERGRLFKQAVKKFPR